MINACNFHTTDSEEDTDDVCRICRDGTSWEHNAIVYCEKCEIPVHQECYGNPIAIEIPEDEWLCEQCLWDAQEEKCCLCGKSGGSSMKRTTDFQWVHLSCALWIPEVFFLDADGREPVDIFRIPNGRWNKKCDICSDKEGCTVKCCEAKCKMKFHVSCGLNKNAFFIYKSANQKGGQDLILVYCPKHARAARRKRNYKVKYVAAKTDDLEE
eukprot:TRINITY_DN1751_c0_g1_i1.p1 TRINITY_DN1751_c0_g1~~TRINITY_DN1751_c0_g1_i1.p1  ORF type:complete len:212 (-),score=35.59 TRINITY_DN1751_c0_g1_i1:331-966(-)